VRFEVFTAMIMKNTVFWNVAPCRYYVNRRFGGTYRPHLQGKSNPRAMNQREQIAVGDTFFGAKSGEYGGWGTTAILFLAKNSCTM
jgi:hypothetical protein